MSVHQTVQIPAMNKPIAMILREVMSVYAKQGMREMDIIIAQVSSSHERIVD